jgi:hypothetical protein
LKDFTVDISKQRNTKYLRICVREVGGGVEEISVRKGKKETRQN